MIKRALLPMSVLVLVFGLGFGLVGCSDDDDPVGDPGGLTGPIDENVQLTCVECHTSEEALKATVAPEEDDGHGEGEAEGEG